MQEEKYKYAMFVNFTEKPFSWSWNSQTMVFKPGESKMMPENIARHFAKHLANKVLVEQGKDTKTSPKRPQDVPEFMAEFNKAFIMEEQKENQSEVEMQINLVNKEPISTNDESSNEVLNILPSQDENAEFQGLNQ